MKKIVLLKSLLLLFALIVGVGPAWAGEETFTYTDFPSTTGADYSKTKNGITVSTNGTVNTSSKFFSAFSGKTLTISSTSGNITKIEITCTANYTSSYGPAKLSYSGDDGSYETKSGSKVGTWTASGSGATSVSFSATAQARMTSVVVTYAAAAAVEPSVSLASGSIEVGGTTTVNYPAALTDMNIVANNSDIATYNDGTITGVKAGTATFTATWSAVSGQYTNTSSPKTLTLTVTKKAPTVSFKEKSKTLFVGDGDYTPEFTTTTTSGLTYTWDTTDPSVATVDNGVITPVGVGTATITATSVETDTYSSKSDAIEVTVKEAPTGDVFELVTDASTLAEGDQVIIVNTGTTVALSTTQQNNNRKETSDLVDNGDGTVTPGSDVEILVLGKADEYWTLQPTTTNSEYYLYAVSSQNYLRSNNNYASNLYKATIESATDDCTTITFTDGTNNRILKYNSSSQIFAAYASGQQSVKLYRKGSASGTAAKVSFSDLTLEEGGTGSSVATWTAPAAGLTITDYKSSDTDVATVTSAGVVTAVSAGTATITVSYAGDGTYRAGTAKFIVTVTAPATPDIVEDSEKIVYDFTSNDNWQFPTKAQTGTASYTGASSTTTSDTYKTITLSASASGYNFNASNYLLVGKNGAYLELPAYGFAVSKIEVEGRTDASAQVKTNIYVGDDVVSTEATGSQSTNTFEIAEAYQLPGNVYKLKVGSNHNMQIVKLTVYKSAQEFETLPMNEKGWTTYVTPNKVDAYKTVQAYTKDEEKQVKIYKVDQFDKQNVSIVELGTDATTDRYLPAATPVIVEGPASTNICLFVTTETASLSGNLLKAGTGAYPSGTGPFYVMQWDNDNSAAKFYRLTVDRAVPAGKAYLDAADRSENISGAPGLKVIGIDGSETTSINEEIRVESEKFDTPVYTLDGRKVSGLLSLGIYVKNGKKFVVK